METEILEDLKEYLHEAEDIPDDSVINTCIKRAVRSFRAKRNYPLRYTDEMIRNDMKRYYSCVFDLSLFWVIRQGVEFQTTHIENNVHRYWNTEEDIYTFHGVDPFVSIIG